MNSNIQRVKDNRFISQVFSNLAHEAEKLKFEQNICIIWSSDKIKKMYYLYIYRTLWICCTITGNYFYSSKYRVKLDTILVFRNPQIMRNPPVWQIGQLMHQSTTMI